MRNEIISRLIEMGYKAESKDCVKNGITKQGISIAYNSSNVSAIVYMDNYVGMDVESAITGILKAFKNAETNAPTSLNVDELISAENLKQNLAIAIQKESTEDIVKASTDYEGIEKYLILNCLGGNGTIKITNQMLEMSKVSESDAWMWATENTLANVKTCDMGELLGFTFTMGMQVVTNNSQIKGASAILFRCVLQKCADVFNTKEIYVLPSSIHECIIVPATMPQADVDNMVTEVNAHEVPAEEQLTNRAYRITL